MGLAVKLLQAVASANLADPQLHPNWYQMRRIVCGNRQAALRMRES